jgi:hypothetical protein
MHGATIKIKNTVILVFLNGTLIFSTDLLQILKYQMLRKSSSGNRVVPCEKTDRWTDMTKLIVAVRNFSHTPKNGRNCFVMCSTRGTAKQDKECCSSFKVVIDFSTSYKLFAAFCAIWIDEFNREYCSVLTFRCHFAGNQTRSYLISVCLCIIDDMKRVKPTRCYTMFY